MDPDRWQEIKAAFNRALELQPEERSAYLDNLNDSAVREEVISLLASHCETGDLMEIPAARLQADPPAITERDRLDMEEKKRLVLVEELFHAALALEPTKRAAFLDGSCTLDPDLRAEVQNLLLMREKPGDCPNPPAYEFGTSLPGELETAVGKSFGHYKILDCIGTGGMGIVYRARDTHLNRSVAIKVLSPEAVADPERKQRFVREAKSVSALNHPNIIHIYDIDRADGIDFIAMEYVAGKTLDQLIGGRGLPIEKTLKYAAQIADALAAAHAAGIIHRDLKPANIMVTEKNLVKVLDFGLAKPIEFVSGDQSGKTPVAQPVTQEGTILGTISYMSPEQAKGEKVDARSDIFSFGSVLYEMLSGHHAFQGGSKIATLSAILHEEPRPIEGIPPELERIIGRCLRKDPERRIQHMDEVRVALEELKENSESGKLPSALPLTAHRRRWMLPAVAALAILLAASALWYAALPPSEKTAQHSPRIVVLPFENLGNHEDAYFAAGMTEEITSRLANIKGLSVISRTTAVGYDQKGKTVRQIGDDLSVDYVLEGSVRWERNSRRADRVRITPQLIRVADDTHVWSDRYERVLADVFAIQSEVAESTVKAMGLTLLPRERTALKEVSTSDLEAYQLYLRGRDSESRGSGKRDVEDGLQMYQDAIRRDSRFAQAFAGAARLHLVIYWEYYDRSPERLVRAREAAEQAVQLRPDLAETHTALGLYYYQGMLDYPKALNEFAAALRIQPNNSETIAAMGYVLRRQGRWAEAVEKFNLVVNLDPKNASRMYDLGLANQLAGRYAEADRAFVRALALNPQSAVVYAARAWTQILWRGDTEKAQAVLKEAAQVAGLTDDLGFIAQTGFRIALYRRDYHGALRRLESEARGAIDNQEEYWPIPLLRAQVLLLTGPHDLAHPSFEDARLQLEKRVREDPDDHRLRSSLGIAYAGLGRHKEAMREARLACALMPASKDALRATSRLSDLALVYTMAKRPAEAIAALNDLLALSGWWSSHAVRLDPRLDPLRSDPRFQALLAKHDPKQ